MKAEDIRDWDDAEIRAGLEGLKQGRFKLRCKGSMMGSANPSLVGQIRRDVARLKTVLRERELAQNA